MFSCGQILNIFLLSAAFVHSRAAVVLLGEQHGGYRQESGRDEHVVHPHHGLDGEEEDAEEEEAEQVHARREHGGDEIFRHGVGDFHGVLEEEGRAGEAERLRGYHRRVELPFREGNDPRRQEQCPRVEEGGDGQQTDQGRLSKNSVAGYEGEQTNKQTLMCFLIRSVMYPKNTETTAPVRMAKRPMKPAVWSSTPRGLKLTTKTAVHAPEMPAADE